MADTGSTTPSRDRLSTAFWGVLAIAGPVVLLYVAPPLVLAGVAFATITYVHYHVDPALHGLLRGGLLLFGLSFAAWLQIVDLWERFRDRRRKRAARGGGTLKLPDREQEAPVSSSTSLPTGTSTVGAVVDGGFTDINAALEQLARSGRRQPQEIPGAERRL